MVDRRKFVATIGASTVIPAVSAALGRTVPKPAEVGVGARSGRHVGAARQRTTIRHDRCALVTAPLGFLPIEARVSPGGAAGPGACHLALRRDYVSRAGIC